MALTRDVAEAVRSVPVRPRGKIETADGKITELVGIVLEPDEPIYRTGDIAGCMCICGSATRQNRADTIKLTRRMPDGREVAIPLKPDPAASDPAIRSSNPSSGNSGRREAGQWHAQGGGRCRGAKPRVVEQPSRCIAR